jgi:hypothetical protein
MAHFAELDESNVVQRIIVVNNNELLDENGNESEQKGIDFCVNLIGGRWVQTSYNGNIRKNFAQPNGVYDEEANAFLDVKPFSSWVLNKEFKWESPVSKPHEFCSWDEESVSWEILPKPFESWIENSETGWWKPPVDYPTDGNNYTWDEATLSWVGPDAL